MLARDHTIHLDYWVFWQEMKGLCYSTTTEPTEIDSAPIVKKKAN